MIAHEDFSQAFLEATTELALCAEPGSPARLQLLIEALQPRPHALQQFLSSALPQLATTHLLALSAETLHELTKQLPNRWLLQALQEYVPQSNAARLEKSQQPFALPACLANKQFLIDSGFSLQHLVAYLRSSRPAPVSRLRLMKTLDLQSFLAAVQHQFPGQSISDLQSVLLPSISSTAALTLFDWSHYRPSVKAFQSTLRSGRKTLLKQIIQRRPELFTLRNVLGAETLPLTASPLRLVSEFWSQLDVGDPIHVENLQLLCQSAIRRQESELVQQILSVSDLPRDFLRTKDCATMKRKNMIAPLQYAAAHGFHIKSLGTDGFCLQKLGLAQLSFTEQTSTQFLEYLRTSAESHVPLSRLSQPDRESARAWNRVLATGADIQLVRRFFDHPVIRAAIAADVPISASTLESLRTTTSERSPLL